GETPSSLGSDDTFHLNDVRRASRKKGWGEAQRQYIRDRYDNNLRFIDDQLTRILRTLDPERDVVLLVADHGEEFWDHGGFEHGHTLFDELLHVPMIAWGPGFTAGRYDAPTSLLDVAPTIAQAVGVGLPTAEGMPLQPLTEGQREPFDRRTQAFGRKLYGDVIWGSLDGQQKYISRAGKEKVFDLGADPSEKADLNPDGAEDGRHAMEQALDRDVTLGFRLDAAVSKTRDDLIARVFVPGGVKDAWTYPDPVRRGESEVFIDDNGVIAQFKGNRKATVEVFFVPNRPAEEIVSEMTLQLNQGEAEVTVDARQSPMPNSGKGRAILRGRVDKRTVSLTYAVAPVPSAEDTVLDGTSIEVCFDLVALGYTTQESCQELQRQLRERLR
ncbi:MAG: sulfatase-like hydrolase/transferase, partial [Myxococcota bacterium]